MNWSRYAEDLLAFGWGAYVSRAASPYFSTCVLQSTRYILRYTRTILRYKSVSVLRYNKSADGMP